MLHRAKVVPKFCQVRNFQSHQVDICIHRSGNLSGRISIMIDVVQQLIVVDQNLCGNEIRLIFWARGHVIEHKFVEAVGLRQLSMQLVMPQLMGTDNAKHPVFKKKKKKNEAVTLNDTVHPFEGTKASQKSTSIPSSRAI